MEDFDQKQDYEIIREKMKDRPINRRKLMRRTIITLSMAILFGVFACITFLVLEPVFSNLLYPEPEPEPVTLPEYTEEILPEDMIISDREEDMDEVVVTSTKQDDEYISEYIITMQKVYSLVRENKKSMVDVVAVSKDVDWFNNTYENKGHTQGVIVANKNGELYIVVMASVIDRAESIRVTFHDGTTSEGFLLSKDMDTELAVLTVPAGTLPKETMEEIRVATLGSSRPEALLGTPVIVLGNPLGRAESLAYGMITSKGVELSLADHNYELLTTDIYGSENATGFLYNFSGEVIGVVDQFYQPKDTKNLIAAVGISEMKPLIEKLSNKREMTYLGIYGIDVTDEANQALGVPHGAYVKKIEMDSPAMKAGIQSGDIITRMDDTEIESFYQYTQVLETYSPGDEVEVVINRQKDSEYQEIAIKITLEDRQ